MLPVEVTLEKLGIALGKELGHGGFARVFEYYDAETGKLDPTRVVKLTEDESDAYTAELARQAQEKGECKNLVRVYAVYECESRREWAREQGIPGYIIVSERLQLIPRDMYEKLPSSGYCIAAGCYDPIDAVKIAEEHGWHPSDLYEMRPYVRDVWTMAASNVYGMAKDLASIGVEQWDDYKPANTMIRPGYGIVASDLGCTSTPNRPTIQRIT